MSLHKCYISAILTWRPIHYKFLHAYKCCGNMLLRSKTTKYVLCFDVPQLQKLKTLVKKLNCIERVWLYLQQKRREGLPPTPGGAREDRTETQIRRSTKYIFICLVPNHFDSAFASDYWTRRNFAIVFWAEFTQERIFEKSIKVILTFQVNVSICFSVYILLNY